MAKVAGNSSSSLRAWRFVGTTVLAAAALRVLGCGVDEPVPDPTEGFNVEQMLTAYGHDVVFPTATAFADAIDVLGGDLETWRAAVDGGADGIAERTSAQESWLTAMEAWQRLEVMQVGPMGSSAKRIGGEDLRDDVYSWPTVNACRVDQETLEEAWTSAAFFQDELVNVHGLDAVEHMLWSEEGVSRCNPGVSIIESGDWAASGVDGIQQKRADYAVSIADHVATIAARIVESWDPAGDDWGTKLATAGDGVSPYTDEIEALNEVFAAFFYLETTVKDRKLAQPLGMRDCDEDLCPEAFESQFADAGLDFLRANVEAGRLLLGEDVLGFDDLLINADREDLVTAMRDALDATIAAIDAVPGTGTESVTSDTASVQAVHDALKGFTDILKGEFAVVLLLDIPSDAASDND